MSGKTFEEQHEKWERWLKKRQRAGNADEPLLVFVDDEETPLDRRYHEMRQLNHPGRNILLFESSDEAIEFIKFATAKKLYLGAVVSDFDNGLDESGKQIETYGNQVLEAAIEYGRVRDHPVVKLLISSINRPINSEQNASLHEFNQTDEAKQKGIVDTFVKGSRGVFIELKAVKPLREEKKEKDPLIPELLYSIDTLKILLANFKKILDPYKDITPPEKDKPIKKTYKPVIEAIKNIERRVEDMLTVWIGIKVYEHEEEERTGKVSPNPYSVDPGEPITVRILQAFFLQEFELAKKKLNNVAIEHNVDLFRFSEITNIIAADESITDENERYKKADKVIHNLSSQINMLHAQLDDMIDRLKNYVPANLITEPPTENELRFTHEKLQDMAKRHFDGVFDIRSVNTPASKSTLKEHSTQDRDSDIPGKKGPKRDVKDAPQTPAEWDDATVERSIKPKMAFRLMNVIFKDLLACIKLEREQLAQAVSQTGQASSGLAGIVLSGQKNLNSPAT